MNPWDRFQINRDGTLYGPYTLCEAKEYLRTGNLVLTDLAWDITTSTWMPLDQFLARPDIAPPPPRPPRPRNAVVLVLLAIVWWFVIMFCLFIVGSFFAGVIVGFLHPNDPEAAGRIVGKIAALPILFGSLGFSIWLTMIGKLPGTER